MNEPERCGVIAYTLPPAPDRPTGVTARCRLALGHEGFHRPSEEPTEPERIRWVRYAADCAEHVLPLAGKTCPEAESAIHAARAWCDGPTRERRGAAFEALAATARAARAATAAARAARATAHAVDAAYAAVYAAVYDSVFVAKTTAYAASTAVYNSSDGAAKSEEHAWQAERRRFYGLEEVEP